MAQVILTAPTWPGGWDSPPPPAAAPLPPRIQPSLPTEILALIFSDCAIGSLRAVRFSSKAFSEIGRLYCFEEITIRTMEGLANLQDVDDVVLGCIRYLIIDLMEIHDLVSNPWIGDPASRLAAALPFLVNLRELDNRTCRFTPALWVAMQSHPTLARVPYLRRFGLEALPVCPRPPTRPPLEVGYIDHIARDGMPLCLAKFAARQRLHVTTTSIGVQASEFQCGAMALLDIPIAGLRTVILDGEPDEVEGLDGDEPTESDCLVRLLARSPTIRTIVVSLGFYGEYDVPSVFDICIGKMLAAVSGLEGLVHPSLKKFWAGVEETSSTNIFFGLSDAKDDDATGTRSLTRLAINADVVDRRPGRHDRINVAIIANAANRLPHLEMLDVRRIDCEQDELVIEALSGSLTLWDPHPSLHLPSSSPSPPGLHTLYLPLHTHFLYPDLSSIPLSSYCPVHRPPSSSTTHTRLPSTPHTHTTDVLNLLHTSGGPAVFFRSHALPRLTAQVQRLVEAIPSLRVVKQEVGCWEPGVSPEEQDVRDFIWEVKGGVAVLRTEAARFPVLAKPYVCPCESLFEGICGASFVGLEAMDVDEWWEDVVEGKEEEEEEEEEEDESGQEWERGLTVEVVGGGGETSV